MHKPQGEICTSFVFNNRFLRERGKASTPKMEYQVFLWIFQKNSSMAILGLKVEKKSALLVVSFFKTKLRQPTGQTFFPAFKPKVAIADFFWNAKKNLVFHFGGGPHASFPQKPVV